MFSELWRRWSLGRSGKKSRRDQRLKRPSALLSLEWLEKRELLSTATPLYIIESTQQTAASGAQPLAGSGPSGFSPSQIQNAYGFNQISFASYAAGSVLPGTGQTIAIVDAYNDPDIYSNLETFDAEYGLVNPNLTVMNQSGQVLSKNGTNTTVTPPAGNSDWAVEESLDVEWAHAIAPGANIVLVEANSASNSALMTAVQTAASSSVGASVVSMSWGETEYSGETSNDSYFQPYSASNPNGYTNSGVTFVAASGDSGAPPIYPATSPYVLAAGGTTLSLNSSGGYGSETAWSDSGGGISAYEPLPSYQPGTYSNGSTTGTSTTRMSPDVAYDANPDTGFAVYDTDGESGWLEVGGTSDAAPQWAALVAIADQGRVQDGEGTLTGSTQTLPMLYQIGTGSSSSTYFHQITSGTTDGDPHYSAGPGYNLATGLGTPVANNVIDYLVSGSTSPPPIPSAPTNLTATAVSSSQINLSWTASSGATDYAIDISSTGGSGTFTQIGTTTGTTYSDTGLSASTTYYYEVFAVNSSGDSGASNVASATTLSPPSPPPVPSAPTNLTATAESSSQINLSWTASSGATDYAIDISSTGGSGTFTQIGTTTGTTYSDTGLSADTTYYYEVFAVNSSGDSPASNIASATTSSPPAPPPTPAAPTGLTATAESSSQINLSWTASSGATDYAIDISSTGSNGWTQIGTTTGTTYSDTGLSASTTYYYEVFAVNSSGDSGASNVASATTLAPPPPSPSPPSSGLLPDGGFESPVLSPGTYVLDPRGTSWSFGGTAGIASNGSSVTGNLPAPQGSQVGFLSGFGSGFVQTVSLSTGTDYTITFDAANVGRSQELAVAVDGTILAMGTATSNQYTSYSTESFYVTRSGNYTIEFVGLNSSGGIALIDNVGLSATPAVKRDASGSGGHAMTSLSGNSGLSGNPISAATTSPLLSSNPLTMDRGLLTNIASPVSFTDQVFAQEQPNAAVGFNSLMSAAFLSPLVTGLRPQATTDPFDWA